MSQKQNAILKAAMQAKRKIEKKAADRMFTNNIPQWREKELIDGIRRYPNVQVLMSGSLHLPENPKAFEPIKRDEGARILATMDNPEGMGIILFRPKYGTVEFLHWDPSEMMKTD